MRVTDCQKKMDQAKIFALKVALFNELAHGKGKAYELS
jgi:hypothetical protein